VSSCYEELRKTKDLREYGWGDGNTVTKIGNGSNLTAVVVVVVG